MENVDKPGGVIGMILITAFFVIGYFDPYFNKTLTKADNFPIVLVDIFYVVLHLAWYV